MRASDSYIWEACVNDGTVRTRGADLRDCTCVTLRPQVAGLPVHQVVGIPLARRFGRGFVRGLGGGLREYLHCVVTDDVRIYVRSTDGGVIITPRDFELYL